MSFFSIWIILYIPLLSIPISPTLIPKSTSLVLPTAVEVSIIVFKTLRPLTASVLVARLSTRILYSASSASVAALAVRIFKSDDVASFWAKISIDATPYFASVTFSITERKELKNDFILFNVSRDKSTVSFCSSSVSIFACFNATSDSTQEEVSNPDANPLNDIATATSCFIVIVYKSSNVIQQRPHR